MLAASSERLLTCVASVQCGLGTELAPAARTMDLSQAEFLIAGMARRRRYRIFRRRPSGLSG